MSEKKIPEVRFKGFSGEWGQRTLGELGNIYTGNTPSTIELSNWAYGDKGHVWITPTDINSLTMATSERYLSDKGVKKARTVPQNSVLITCIASIGKNTINTVPTAFNQQINAIVPVGNDAYFLLSAMIKDTMKFASRAGQTATAIINKTEFEKYELKITKLAEQTKIGKFFKNLDTLITLRETKLEKLKNIKKACLDKMFI